MHELYELGLEHTIANNDGAWALFGEAWHQRSELDSNGEAYCIVLTAGTAFAAHLALTDETEDEREDVEDVLKAINPDRDRLWEPIASLFELLSTGSTEQTPEEITEDLSPETGPDRDVELEAQVVAELMQRLENE